MRRDAVSVRLLALVVVATVGVSVEGCKRRKDVVVFHPTSLAGVLGELGERLEAKERGLAVRLEPSGSLLAVRKVTEQGLRADLVAAADVELLRRSLVPSHATKALVFATDELVLSHLGHSPSTAEVTPENWPELVLASGARLGCVDPDLSPIGYHTRMAWRLAEEVLARPGLAGRLQAACTAPTQDETALLALLEAKAIDYAFVYASSAEAHRLKVTRLPDEANLSRLELEERYARVSVEVRAGRGEAPVRLRGRAITYGLAVLDEAPNAEGARALVTLLGSEVGRRTLQRHGLHPALEELK